MDDLELWPGEEQQRSGDLLSELSRQVEGNLKETLTYNFVIWLENGTLTPRKFVFLSRS